MRFSLSSFGLLFLFGQMRHKRRKKSTKNE
nr:MAG TPA: hypothetical protein [Caudoviricetes sp.]